MASKGKLKHYALETKDSDSIAKSLTKKERSQSLDRVYDENSENFREMRKNRRQLMHLISEKNEQIEKLIKRVSTLHSLNNQFALEHEKLQKELEIVQRKCHEYSLQCEKSCESCRVYSMQTKQNDEEVDRLTRQNAQLSNDINMMKTLIYRLNIELERFQELCRKQEFEGKATSDHWPESMCLNSENLGKGNTDHIDWGSVHSNVLAPLLNAYQETIRDKHSLLNQYECEMNHIAGRIKDVFVENEQFCMEIDHLKRERNQWTSKRIQAQIQIDVFRNKAEIHSKRADLAKEKLNDIISCYERKLQTQAIDMQRLQEAYIRIKNELRTCKTMHQEPELIVESLKEYKRLYEESKTQYDLKITKLLDDFQDLKKVQSKSEAEKTIQLQKIAEQNSVIEGQNQNIRTLEQKMAKVRHKFKRLRQSREILKDRLQSTLTWNKKTETVTKTVDKTPWHGMHTAEQLLLQKELQIQQLRTQYFNEVQKLQRKLTRRDEMLRKILLSKLKNAKRK